MTHWPWAALSKPVGVLSGPCAQKSRTGSWGLLARCPDGSQGTAPRGGHPVPGLGFQAPGLRNAVFPDTQL